MISLEKCRSVLAETGEGLTEEELAAVREILYQKSKFTFEIFINETEADKDGIPLHQS